jgi:hypothetical protein
MQSFAFDIGSHFNTGIYGFVLGMSINNLGPEVEFEGDGLEFECKEDDAPTDFCKKITDSFILPLTFRIGLSNEIMGPESDLIKSENNKLLLSFDIINPIDYTMYGAFGMEYNNNDMFYARAGTHLSHDTADWSLGAGLNIDIKNYKFGLDYAYVNYGILDFTHNPNQIYNF